MRVACPVRVGVADELAVVFEPSEVDHRLHGEEHARAKLGPGPGSAGMDHLGAVVEQLAKAMAAEIAHH